MAFRAIDLYLVRVILLSKSTMSNNEERRAYLDGPISYQPAGLNSDSFSEGDDDDDEENEGQNGENDRIVAAPTAHDGIMRHKEEETATKLRRLLQLVILLSILLVASLVRLVFVQESLSRLSLQQQSNPSKIPAKHTEPPAATPTATCKSINAGTGDSSSAVASRVAATALVDGVALGAVASDHAVCSRLGAHTILQQWQGNAVDAAVATALCLGLVNPASSGLGGGAFMLIHHSLRTIPSSDNATSTTVMPDFIDQRDKTTRNNNDDSSATQKITEVIDCRERAPSAAHTHMYDGLPANASVVGGLAIPVLGELKCLELAHARFGLLPWSSLLEPVIELASNGIVVGPYLASQIHDTAHRFRSISISSSSSSSPSSVDSSLRKFLTASDDWNDPLLEGSILRNPELVSTLKAIARDGVKALYVDRATKLSLEIQQAGGIVTPRDIMDYRATLRSPLVSRNVNGFTLVGVPPPSSGGAAVLGAVRFLSGFQTPLASFADTLSTHRIVEACKHVFAIRMSLSDPDFNTAHVTAAVNDLVNGTYMENLRRSSAYYCDDSTVPLSNYGGKKWAQLKDGDGSTNATDAKEGDRMYSKRSQRRKLQRSFGYLEDHGTSHFSVVDQQGNSVAMTTSVNTNFGSMVRSASTGIIFSNTMDDFSKPDLPNHYGLRPAESNYIKPGKRPLSSMSPTLVFRDTNSSSNSDFGDFVMAIGASGGPKIITSVLQVLLNYVMLGKSLLESVVHPRLHDQLIYHGSSVSAAEHAELRHITSTIPNNMQEKVLMIDVSQQTRAALTKRGHNMLDIDFSGTVQAVAIDLDTDQLSAASDPRKGGSPAGY